jgi:hypothetical protein
VSGLGITRSRTCLTNALVTRPIIMQLPRGALGTF